MPRYFQVVCVVNKRGFNNEVQHLEEQKGACYSKWIWGNNIGI